MVTLAEIVANCASAMKAPSTRWKRTARAWSTASRSTAWKTKRTASAAAAVVDLFNNEKDPIRLIKLKEVYEYFEQTIDACEDVADVLQNVVVKNS